MLLTEITEFYRAGAERDRLAAGHGRLEYLRTWDVLSRVLPPAPAQVLDVGGARGVYAAPLAGAGYQVHLVDPVPEHVAIAAGELPGVQASLGDARALPVPDASADAVLMLGPLYHLTERADRVRAWREAARAARPGAPLVAALISRFASLFDGFVAGHADDPEFTTIVDRALATGVHRNDSARPRWFTTAYFHHPSEVPDELAEAGLRLRRLVLVEGPIWMAGPRLAEILADAAGTERLLDRLRAVEEEPSLLGASSHLLAIADHR